MKILAVIPARYASTRFPGKPLVEIDGKSMIQRVYEQCKQSTFINKVVVATDDERILNHVKSFGGAVMMTSDEHESGTERCGEVLMNLEDAGEDFDVVVNVQGDEPFIDPEQINKVCEVFKVDKDAEIATLAKKITSSEELFNENVVKVVMTDAEEGEIARDALYFSRNPIPFLRGSDKDNWLKEQDYYKHVGVYAFAVKDLHNVLELEKSPLEQSESLEQLRWIANHFTIQVVETDKETIGIDTPEDLTKLRIV